MATRQEIPHAPEIVTYLTNLLSMRRSPIEERVFKRDPQMYRRIGQYEKALAEFLAGESKVLVLGDDMRNRELWMENMTTSYQREIDQLDEDSLLYQLQRDEAADSLQELNARIAGIGRNRLTHGDLGLLIGRVQVELWQLKQRGRLNILGRLTERLIGSRQVHPQVEPYQEKLTETEERLEELRERRRNSAAEHFRQESEQKRRLGADQEELLHMLGGWIITQPADLFVVHHLYHGHPSVNKYLGNHHLGGKEQDDLLNMLKQHRTSRIPQNNAEGEPFSVPVQVDTLKDQTLLPMTLIIEGQPLAQIEPARERFDKLLEGLSERRKEQIFNRLVRALQYEMQGSHHRESTILTADDMIKRIGGNWRLQVGRYRVVGNLITTSEGERALEIANVLQRDDHKYY